MHVPEQVAGPLFPYLVGLGLRLLVRCVTWCNSTELRWWNYWKWLGRDFKGIVTLLVVGVGCASLWTTGIVITAAQDYIPADLSALHITTSTSVMAGYLFSLLVCKRLKLEGM